MMQRRTFTRGLLAASALGGAFVARAEEPFPNRPVKLVATRDQGFTIQTYRAETRQRIRIGARRDGKIPAFIHEGHLARHLRKTRAIYDERRLAFLEEAKVLADLMEFGPARAGMHVTGLFKQTQRVDDWSVAAECARAGVQVHPLSRYGATDRGGLVFGFAAASRAVCRQGLEVVRRAILAG